MAARFRSVNVQAVAKPAKQAPRAPAGADRDIWGPRAAATGRARARGRGRGQPAGSTANRGAPARGGLPVGAAGGRQRARHGAAPRAPSTVPARPSAPALPVPWCRRAARSAPMTGPCGRAPAALPPRAAARKAALGLGGVLPLLAAPAAHAAAPDAVDSTVDAITEAIKVRAARRGRGRGCSCNWLKGARADAARPPAQPPVLAAPDPTTATFHRSRRRRSPAAPSRAASTSPTPAPRCSRRATRCGGPSGVGALVRKQCRGGRRGRGAGKGGQRTQGSILPSKCATCTPPPCRARPAASAAPLTPRARPPTPPAPPPRSRRPSSSRCGWGARSARRGAQQGGARAQLLRAQLLRGGGARWPCRHTHPHPHPL
jgi:hypothetical protein